MVLAFVQVTNLLEVCGGCASTTLQLLPLKHPTKRYRTSNSLVGADTGSLEGLGAQLFILVGNQVDAQGELVDVRTLSAKIEDSDLGIRYTTVEPRLGIRL
jgi:hypothetical protein